MSEIAQENVIRNVAATLQLFSCSHPADFVCHLARAYEDEKGANARQAIGQIGPAR
ncbi:hypothetical protein [Mesorhizobium xinjiangense]|uniref:hypothetical protein n=1 Tax=Mesorhizobium xinjiangense TaxID=2678685 RepID=UPI0012EE5D72|nr:hypothetical protein [Mesorhizobium xinjiangense]